MIAQEQTVVLITGANRGLGRGLVEQYLARPATTVLATVRNPSSADAQSLLSLSTAKESSIHVLKVSSTSDTDVPAALETVSSLGINHIDILIANAGIFDPDHYKPVSRLSISEYQEHLDVNTVGPFRLFTGCYEYLKRSREPKFVFMSSLVGTTAGLDKIPWPNSAYGSSKAAFNHLVRRIHFEEENFVTLAVHPGAVKSDTGNKACQAVGFPEAFVDVVDSAKAVVEKIDKTTKESGSGTFWGYGDDEIVW